MAIFFIAILERYIILVDILPIFVVLDIVYNYHEINEKTSKLIVRDIPVLKRMKLKDSVLQFLSA
ncbi:hypothetical protein AXF35_08305 [Legionella pneumophila subsp. pascullei]|nr:hypothetical protein AXF35_08305 [Legionella pneumophila subsp. pascullei]AMP92654.1 hypothetical protein AXF36_08495 [Legionella pneumophila subsp. pascullei]AMP95619.1 hypothetical protein AXF37_08385 [Legionella pneumophila subsp. pascullei]